MRERKCNWCALSGTSKGPVWGYGDPQARLRWYGEAPGKDEDNSGVPFVGKAGKESDNYKARYGIRVLPQFTSNVVKCRPPKNRDPKPHEIKACAPHFEEELGWIPDDAVIGTLGRFSTASFLGEVPEMEYIHGIPQRHERGWIVVPVYHPAVGLYDGRFMSKIDLGYKAVADALEGRITPEDWIDPFPNPRYSVLNCQPGGTVVGVDTESVHGKIWSVQISVQPGEAYLVLMDSPYLGWLKQFLEDPKRLVLLHNAQHDLAMLAQLDIHPKLWADTMLMANLLCDQPRGLKFLAYRLCGMKMQSYPDLIDPINDERIIEYLEEVAEIEWPDPDPVWEIKDGLKKMKRPQALHKRVRRILKDVFAQKCSNPYERWTNQPQEMRDMAAAFLGKFHTSSIADLEFDKALYYACRDADATIRIYPKLWERIKAYSLQDALALDQGITPMLSQMEEVGVEVNVNILESFARTLTESKDRMLLEIKDRVGYWVNPSSHDQVRNLLYKKLKLKAPSTKGHQANPTTDQDYLEKIKTAHPVVPRILAYRAADKLKGSFVDRLLRMKDSSNRVHDDLSQIRTTSGRLTSSIMLLIPKRGELADSLRKAFVAKPGCVFLSADYSQIELRMLADMSQDPLMLKAYREDIDLHTLTASNIFGVPIEKVDKTKHRYPAKTVNFGIVYGMTADGLFEQLGQYGWTMEGCDRLIKDWFRLYRGAGEFMKQLAQQAKRYGFVTTISGRRRLIPEVRSVHPWIRNKGIREAGNHPIQGSANEIMKRAMALLWPKFQEMKTRFYIEPLLQIHDDLKVETAEDHLSEVARCLKHNMENAWKLSIPTPVDMEFGYNWGEMHEVKVK